jgi:hypothetical protein
LGLYHVCHFTRVTDIRQLDSLTRFNAAVVDVGFSIISHRSSIAPSPLEDHLRFHRFGRGGDEMGQKQSAGE